MKKLLVAMVALAGLAGCTYYDYYKGGVRYTQDGRDCVVYAEEYARNYSETIRGIDGNNRTVYRNTRCADLFARDTVDTSVAPAARTECYGAKSCQLANSVKTLGCGNEMAPISRRYYTIVTK